MLANPFRFVLQQATSCRAKRSIATATRRSLESEGNSSKHSRTTDDSAISAYATIGRKRQEYAQVTSHNFQPLYRLWRRRRRPYRVYEVAAYLVTRELNPSELVWYCALRHHIVKRDLAGFKQVFSSMLVKACPLKPTTRLYSMVWEHAVTLGMQDINFLNFIYAAVRTSPWPDEAIKSSLYRYIMSSLCERADETLELESLLEWHSRLLNDRFRPDRLDRLAVLRQLCANSAAMPALRRLFVQFRSHGMKFSFHNAVVSELCRLKRFDDAQRMHEYLLAKGEKPVTTESIDDLLQFHLNYSSQATALAFLNGLKRTGVALSTAAKYSIGRFHGSTGAFDVILSFSRIHFKDSQFEALDRFWAGVLHASQSSGHNFEEFVRRMQLERVPFGEHCLRACIETGRDLDRVWSLLDEMSRRGFQLTAREYAVLVRLVAQQGQVERAENLVRRCLHETVTPEDGAFLSRNLILGLLEGGCYGSIEHIHRTMFLERKSTADTWNLLLRARLQDHKVAEAIAGLEEMRLQDFHVENATAQEFMKAILKKRSPGKLPNVLNENDIRPYLVDIRMAISVVYKCMTLGRRVQPETWREVMKRMSLYGEFDSLSDMSDWLILQYSTSTALPGTTRKLFVPSPTQQQLSSQHPEHPLSRLFWPRDIPAVVTRGFVRNKPKEALLLILRWQTKGVNVNCNAVETRVRTGLKFMAQRPGAKISQVRHLRDVLHRILEELRGQRT